MVIPTQINLHEQIPQESDVKIEDKSKINSRVSDEFDDVNNSEDSTEYFKMQENIEKNKTTRPQSKDYKILFRFLQLLKNRNPFFKNQMLKLKINLILAHGLMKSFMMLTILKTVQNTSRCEKTSKEIRQLVHS